MISMPTDSGAKKPAALLSVADATTAILAMLPRTATVEMPLADCLGLRLAEDLTAVLTLPPQSVSAMDGYAVRQDDVATLPAKLRRIAESAAGHPWQGRIGPGEAVRVFTGAAIPEGADTIVIQEDVDAVAEENGTVITVRDAEVAGRYIRPAGLDISAGEIILSAGTLMSARSIALAIASGLTHATVHQRPRIGILSTGDELVLPGQNPGNGQIISSNAAFLSAFVQTVGAVAVDLGIARDRPGAMLRAVRAVPNLDLVVTTGGASVGNHDHIVGDLNQGAKGQAGGLNFWKIAMRPGKPLISGRVDDIPLIGLPGNPVSTAVCALIFLGPAIARLCNGVAEQPQFLVRLAADLAENDQRQDYIRATLSGVDADQLVTPATRQDSSMMAVLAKANALIVRPPFDPVKKAGDLVSVLPIPPLF